MPAPRFATKTSLLRLREFIIYVDSLLVLQNFTTARKAATFFRRTESFFRPTLIHHHHLYPHLAIYFGSPFTRCPTFHTLMSVGRKKLSVCLKNVAAFSCRSVIYVYIYSAVELFDNLKNDTHAVDSVPQ